jgi:sterol desaturase/sphingolipid hydroxylase (fatty acid hydroxylase superfamily)
MGFKSNTQDSVRMFKSDLLESLSKVHWSVPLIVWVPVIFYSGWLSIFTFSVSISNFIIYFIAGVFFWTFAEYFLHRFVFHWTPKGKWGERIHFIFHGVHHDYPNDAKRLVMPPSLAIPLGAMFYFSFELVLGRQNALAFFPGFMVGYLFYDMTHFALHHSNFKSAFWRKLKQHHMTHHYNDATRGFGVSSTLWDKILGSEFIKKSS